MKRCKGDCKKEKPLDSFTRTKNYCKVCINAKLKRKRDADKQDKDKVCKGICGKLLPGIKFNKGLSRCKVCKKEYDKRRREGKQDEDRVCTGCDKLLPGDKFYKGESQCKVCEAERNKQWRKADKRDRPKVCQGKWSCGKQLPGKSFNRGWNTCKECDKKRRRTPEFREKINARDRKRRKEDPQFAMRCRLRSRIGKWLKGAKSAHTMELVGCLVEVCMLWIESQFLPGMTWENQHLWHIDHMKPLDSFDALDPEEQRKACHYTNLQPLWGPENRRKSNKDIYDMEWRDEWYIKLGDEYVSRKEQVKNKISTHKYYPL